ncbi:MAG: Fur family transcriptional regulator [Desulfatibacillaceae bacterium]
MKKPDNMDVCSRLLSRSGLDYTPNRHGVLEVVAMSDGPVTAPEIHRRLSRLGGVNRTTVYRILDLMVEHGLLERISSGDGVFRYGVGETAGHTRHPHFFCTRCREMACLDSETVNLDMDSLCRNFSGRVYRIEVRMDGICEACLGRK